MNTGDRLPVHASPYPGGAPYPDTDTAYHSPLPQSQSTPYPENDHNSQALPHPTTAHAASPYQHQPQYSAQSDEFSLPGKIEPRDQEPVGKPPRKKLSKKWRRRLYWMVPLGIVSVVLLILFEVYKDDFQKWVKPLADWLRDRDAWSWVIPVAILFLLSFPPLFGHEVVFLIVGLTYPIGVGIGIACAGSILGEAGCFVLFKYFFTWWVDKKIEQDVKWAATARVSREAGFRGVLIIRYSIVPPHLANPLFACTGMPFWLYMITVILSLPKTIIFVILGAPAAQNTTAAKIGKVIAIGVLVVITVSASIWIRKKSAIAINDIKAERAGAEGDEMHEMLSMPGQIGMSSPTSAKYGKLSPGTDVDLPKPNTYGKPSPITGMAGINTPSSSTYGRSPGRSEMDIAEQGGRYGNVAIGEHSSYGSSTGQSDIYGRNSPRPGEFMTSPEQTQGMPKAPRIYGLMSPPGRSGGGRVPTPLQAGQMRPPRRQQQSESSQPPGYGLPGQAF